jgi:hypothetical protein
LALRERSRRMGVATAAGILAALPAPLLFAAPVRENLAYVFNDFRIPTDTSWSSILGDYPSRLSDVIVEDIKYPPESQFPILIALAMGAIVIAGLVLLYYPWRSGDPFLSMIRASAVGGLITILISVNYTGLRLELVFIPAAATGVALLWQRLIGSTAGTDPQPRPGALVEAGGSTQIADKRG